MITSTSDRRVLGALRCVNAASGLPVPGPLRVTAAPRRAGDPVPAPGTEHPPVKVLRNRLGLYVLHAAPGFAAYQASFSSPPAAPAPLSQSLRLRVEDPSRRHFPTEVNVALPRPADLVPFGTEPAADSVFRPLDVPMLPTPSAPVADGWAVLRVLVWRETTNPAEAAVPLRHPVPGALVRVLTDGNNPRLLGRGLTEWQRFPGEPARSASEALVAVPGIPVTMWNEQPNGPVLTENQDVRLEVRFDTGFDPAADPLRIPDFTRLEPPGNAALPAGVVGGTLTNALTLRARARTTLEVIFNPQNQPRLGP